MMPFKVTAKNIVSTNREIKYLSKTLPNISRTSKTWTLRM